MSSPNLHPMLNVAVKAARSAGSIINRAALDVEAVRISQKQVNDFVTEVDHASEKAIIETLLTAYPDHGSWPRNRAASMEPRMRNASGSLIRWTAPPTSSTASPSIASALRWPCAARSNRP
jgi:myo-inositol-1(or 4)-monophosphatase